MDTILRRALGGPGDGGLRVTPGGGGAEYGGVVGLSPAIQPPTAAQWNPLRNINALYSADPTVPDPLPPVINYMHDFPDTDERDLHNYPGEPVDMRLKQPMTPLQAAFQTRGYADIPGGNFGPQDVTNSVTQPKGLLPLFGRAPLNTLTIDPLDGRSFKPPKSEVSQSDLREAPTMGWNVFGNKWNGTQQMAYIEPYTKWRSGVGAYNDIWPSQVDPANPPTLQATDGNRISWFQDGKNTDGTVSGAQYGFSTGEQLVARSGTEHWGNKRIWREEPCKKKVLFFRLGNPSTAAPRFQSEWAQCTGPLGELSVPYNARVKEWYREPMPTAGLTADRLGAHELVVMPFSNRTGCPPGSCMYQRTDDGGMQEVMPMHEAENRMAGMGGTHRAWIGQKGATMNANEAMRLHNEQRDVIPNKTTQFPLGSGFPVAGAELKGPVDANPVRLRPTHRTCYEGASNAISDPAPFYGAGGPAVYNTEYVLDPHNIKEIGSAYRVSPNAPAPGCMAVENGCLVPGTHRPGGPCLGLGSTADRWAVNRVNPAYARPCLKEQLINDCAVRPPMSDVYYAPQRGDFPAPENRKVTPLIQQDIDASLLQAYRQNPYAQPLASDA